MGDDIPPELEELLNTDFRTGLTTEEAEKRFQEFGPNGKRNTADGTFSVDL